MVIEAIQKINASAQNLKTMTLKLTNINDQQNGGWLPLANYFHLCVDFDELITKESFTSQAAPSLAHSGQTTDLIGGQPTIFLIHVK